MKSVVVLKLTCMLDKAQSMMSCPSPISCMQFIYVYTLIGSSHTLYV